MRTKLLRGILLAGLFVMGANTAQAGGMIAWRKSLNEAMLEAKRSHKLLMVDFYTGWCGYCKKLDAETYTDAGVIRLSDQVVSVKVDAEHEGKALATKYKVRGYPTILFLNETGGVEGNIGGYLPPAGFSQRFTETMKRHQDFLAAQSRFQQNAFDVQTAFQLEGFYASQGDGAKTVAMQQQVARLDPLNTKGLLTRSYLYLGDYYSLQGQFDKSSPLYKKVITVSKTPKEVAYAHLSLAYVSLSQNHPKQALPELKAVKAVANCPADIKGAAQQMLEQLRQKGVQ